MMIYIKAFFFLFKFQEKREWEQGNNNPFKLSIQKKIT